MFRTCTKVFAIIGAIIIAGTSPKGTRAQSECWSCVPCGALWTCQQSASGGYQCVIHNDNCSILMVCPAGGGGCFLPGTMVETEGGMKAIEEIRAGDRVLGLKGSGHIAGCDIERTYKSLHCSYYVINGKIRVTGTHPFFVDGKWVEASKIEVGDHLTGKDSSLIEVKTIEVIKRGVRAYNIEVADAHTFYVEGVLVHNKGPEPGLP